MLKVIDNFVNDNDTLFLYRFFTSNQSPWFFGNDYDGSNNKRNFFCKTYTNPNELHHLVLVPEIHRIYWKIRDYIPDTEFLRKIYVNCVKAGDKSEFHQDHDGTTVLIYFNPIWRFWWGSGTRFEKFRLVRPKPGRAIFFDGLILHKSVSPNLLMNDRGRFSIVFQFSKN